MNSSCGESWPPAPTAIEGLEGAFLRDLVAISFDGNQLTLRNPQPISSVTVKVCFAVIGAAMLGVISYLVWFLNHLLVGPAFLGMRPIIIGLSNLLVVAAVAFFVFAYQVYKLMHKADVLVFDRVKNTIVRNGTLIGRVDQVKRMELLPALDRRYADKVHIVLSNVNTIPFSTGRPAEKSDLGRILGEFCRVKVVTRFDRVRRSATQPRNWHLSDGRPYNRTNGKHRRPPFKF